MDTSKHTINTLFEQLGLPSDEASVDQFISEHSPLPAGTAIQDAPFWSESQSNFLEEGLEQDSDWAEIIDELDARMRH
ncbi:MULTISPECIES: DUF2789 domain-containing protein [Marinobacter]|uniref:DUF2789 domain-containing protein n=1 Tax=Marinobacter suaedae TaxID=3057675 RepID=A0ABT8W0L4_9GAMM|nr:MULTISPECIES: DUF2789 domain-containing protein [unclassified Marinobacter]MBZ2170320.1 DUF2789 domain-containing protein [Marinobacter sp. F4216]MDO3721718.1 DUF2789 domain-containing protein [Marinobacter sp. chi1]